MRIYALLTSISLISLHLFGQVPPVEGYVLLTTGDTLRGMIQDNVETESDMNWQRIRFIDAAGKGERMKALKVLEYQKKGFPPYRSIVTKRGTKKFARVVVDGEVILYKYFHPTGMGGGSMMSYGSSTFGNRGVSIGRSAPSVNIEYYVQRKGSIKPPVEVPNSGFKKAMAKFFDDDPDIKSRIENETMVRGNLEEAIREYNAKKHN